MPIYRVSTELIGLAGGTGLSVFHFDAAAGTAQQAQDAVDNFWAALDASMSSNITATPTNEVVTINEATGVATAFTATVGIAQQGDGVGSRLSPALQGLIRWTTAGVVNGRQVKGRMFVPGPEEGNNTSGGVPEATYITAVQLAANGLLAAPMADLVIWSRPVEADPLADPPVAACPGSFHLVTGASVWGQWAVLRGRRDA